MRIRSLRMNPQKHEIVCEVDNLNQEDGYAEVSIKLSDQTDGIGTCGVLSESEAEKIGKWFLKLAKEIKG